MPPSAESLLEAVLSPLGQLEQLCNELELSLRSNDWPRMERAISETRRSMHEFENAMGDAVSVRTADFDRTVYARLQRIYEVRDEQLRRLAEYHDSVGNRLRAISQWKGYARSIGGWKQPRVQSRLFEDMR